jgi:hypothetical protein
METCKSPRTVLVAAQELAQQFLPDYNRKFRRKDFTLPQRFACLVLREHQKKAIAASKPSWKDCPDWRADIGLKRTPDHNTLCRAFPHRIQPGRLNRMLDLRVVWAKRRGMIRGRLKPVALDSRRFESPHVSRHFEKRPPQTARQKAVQIQAHRRRRSVVKRRPKRSWAVASASHRILAARATTGRGGDQPFFKPLRLDVWRRVPIWRAVADAGFDSEAKPSSLVPAVTKQW